MELLKPNEAADFLRISIRTLYDWSSQGRIPKIKLHKGKKATLLFDKDELIKWVEDKRIPEKGDYYGNFRL